MALEICMTNSGRDREDDPHILLEFLGDRLDPDPILALLGHLRSTRPVRKGDPVSRPTSTGRPARAAVTGVCLLSTGDRVDSDNPNDHLAFLLDEIEPHAEQLREIRSAADLVWQALLFTADESPELPPLDTSLLERLRKFDLPLRAKGPERVTFVTERPPK